MASVLREERRPRDGSRPAKTVRIGLLGLGRIGSAVATVCRDTAGLLARRGLVPMVDAALVRRPDVRRETPPLPDVTDDVDRFFSHPFDVVVEALGGVEPACALVRRALDAGIPVVTANKSLVAAHGPELAALAARRGVAFRYEASVIAGVPFLGTFEARPLASRIDAVAGILNGTSNFILTQIAGGANFDDALATAQRLGYAEPDPAMDVTGADAAEKLTILIRQFAGLRVSPAAIPATGLVHIDPADLDGARACGGVIRPVAFAQWRTPRLGAFVAPAFVPDSHPLAAIAGSTNGLLLTGTSGTQFYSGPGAGPAITAATLLDDVVEAIARGPVDLGASETVGAVWEAPIAGALVRVDGATTHAAPLADLIAGYGIVCSHVVTAADRVYLQTFPAERVRLDAALDAIRSAAGAQVAAFPALEAAC
ncbi:MAG TPA: homoserine dehydrogenase [Vicinamibacterales bacterium]|nr:homoserine dehydrogenase [Vicinamibacterales bacterium]